MLASLSLILLCQLVGEAVVRGPGVPLLGPATVALAVRLYESRKRVVSSIVPMLVALVAGSVTAGVAMGIAESLWCLGSSPCWCDDIAHPTLYMKRNNSRYRGVFAQMGPKRDEIWLDSKIWALGRRAVLR